MIKYSQETFVTVLGNQNDTKVIKKAIENLSVFKERVTLRVENLENECKFLKSEVATKCDEKQIKAVAD